MSDDSNHHSGKITSNRLIQLRKELIYDISELEKELQRKRDMLFHISETIKVVDPKVVLDALPTRHRRGTKSPWLDHGEITEFVYDVGRDAPDRVFSSHDVTMSIMAAKSLDPDMKPDQYKDFENRVRLQLNALRRQKVVDKVDGRGPHAQWRLIK